MKQLITENEHYSFYQKDNEHYLQFKALTDKPSIRFQIIEMVQYQSTGTNYLDELTEQVMNSPSSFYSRLEYPLDQTIKTVREAYYQDNRLYYERFFRSKKRDPLSKIKLAIGMYSAGNSNKSIKAFIAEILANKQIKYLSPDQLDDYYGLSSIICLAHLLDLSDELYNQDLESLVEKDRLLHFLYTKNDETDITKPLLHDEPYLFLDMFIRGQEDYMNDYLERFYNSFKNSIWYHSHLNDNKEFFGYWSFELAFLVRFHGKSDRLFIDHMYYPMDLARRKWMPSFFEGQEGEDARKMVQSILDNDLLTWHEATKSMVEIAQNEIPMALTEILKNKKFRQSLEQITDEIGKIITIEKTPDYSQMKNVKPLITSFANLLKNMSSELISKEEYSSLQKNIKNKVLAQLENDPGKLEPLLNDYLKSEQFKSNAQLKFQEYNDLSKKLLENNSIEDDEKYWNELEKLFDQYGLLNEGAAQNLESEISKSVDKSLKDKIGDVSFKISFNDFL